MEPTSRPEAVPDSGANDTGRRLGPFVLVTTALAGLGALFFLADPASSGFFWNCPFHALTGWYCPGCGTQRAVHELLHGHVKEAIGMNALAVLVILPGAVWAYVSFALRAFGWTRVSGVRLSGRWLAVLLGLAILFGVLRNLPYDLP